MPIVETHWSTLLERAVSIEVGDVLLKGDLVVPEEPFGVVLLSSGIGMSRSSTRPRCILRELEELGLATLTLDLLGAPEEMHGHGNGVTPVENSALAERLAGATAWVKRQPQLKDFPLGYFAAGNGSAAMLEAAAGQRGLVDAVVSWNGNANQAAGALERIQAPTLLLVGNGNAALAQENEAALFRLGASRKELILIPSSSSRSTEMEDSSVVADLAADWYSRYLIFVS